jgi:hypothetical protein
MEIIYKETGLRYELLIPDEIARAVGLMAGNTAPKCIPFHTDRSQLEQLATEIAQVYARQMAAQQTRLKSEKSNNRIGCIAITLLLPLVLLGAGPLSKVLGIDLWKIAILAILIILYLLLGIVRMIKGFPLVNAPLPLIGTTAGDKYRLAQALDISRLERRIKTDFSG